MNAKGAKRRLESAGYRYACAAASLGGPLVGVPATDVVLCQVKTRDLPGAAETETRRTFAARPNCRNIVHCWSDRQRLPHVQPL